MNQETQQANGLPAGWVWTTLGEVTDTTRRRVQPQDHPSLRFVGMEHVEAHTMRVLSTVAASEMRSTAEYFEPGDVLYGRLRPYLNKVFCADFTGLCSGEFIAFRKVEHVVSKYLLYFLNSWEFVSFASHLNEGDRPRVNIDQLAGYPFPLAPLPEQHRIVAEIETQFTRLDAGVAALKRVQAKLRHYKAAVLKAACEGRLVPTEAEMARVEGREFESGAALLARILAERRAQWERSNPGKRYVEPKGVDTDGLAALPEGWVWVRLEHIAEQRLGKMLDKVKNKGELRPYLRNINVRWFGFDLSDIQEMRIMEREIDDVSVKEGDLVVCEGGEPGRAAVWSHPSESPIIQKALHRVRPFEGVSAWYLAYRLAADANSGKLERYFTGSTIKHFTGQSLRSYVFALPPTAEQHRTVAEVQRRLSVAQDMESTVTASLKRAERLRQSILKRAFEGRLVAQDPNDEPAFASLARIRAARGVGA